MKKLLLDECIPRKLKDYLPGHDCTTVSEAGWMGTKNGELIALAEQAGFEVFLTLDQGLRYEQNLTSVRMAVIVVRARSSRLADLISFVPEMLVTLNSIQPAQVVIIPE